MIVYILDDKDLGIIFNKDEFKASKFQCVCEYLKRFDSQTDISDFKYDSAKHVQMDYRSCISTIIK